jgi:hypothetical protein
MSSKNLARRLERLEADITEAIVNIGQRRIANLLGTHTETVNIALHERCQGRELNRAVKISSQSSSITFRPTGKHLKVIE